MRAEPSVFIVDDDPAMCSALRRLLRSEGFNVETYVSAQEFLESYSAERPGCLVLDVQMPGMSGLDLQQLLAERNIHIPVIVLTGHASVPTAVTALKAGATDFLEKPFDNEVLLARVRDALALDAESRQARRERAMVEERLALLTPREREVMELMVEGRSSKLIAAELGLSARTVEIHRARIMDKMQCGSLADLVRMVFLIKTPAIQDLGR